MARKRSRALELLEDAQHSVMTRGPEGRRREWDAKGKRIKGGGKVEYQDFAKYIRELEVEAGVVDPELEAIVKRVKASRKFWGTAGPDSAVVKKDTP
jgi:hypothetical protein